MHWLYNSMPKFSKIAQSARSTLKKKREKPHSDKQIKTVFSWINGNERIFVVSEVSSFSLTPVLGGNEEKKSRVFEVGEKER